MKWFLLLGILVLLPISLSFSEQYLNVNRNTYLTVQPPYELVPQIELLMDRSAQMLTVQVQEEDASDNPGDLYNRYTVNASAPFTQIRAMIRMERSVEHDPIVYAYENQTRKEFTPVLVMSDSRYRTFSVSLPGVHEFYVGFAREEETITVLEEETEDQNNQTVQNQTQDSQPSPPTLAGATSQQPSSQVFVYVGLGIFALVGVFVGVAVVRKKRAMRTYDHEKVEFRFQGQTDMPVQDEKTEPHKIITSLEDAIKDLARQQKTVGEMMLVLINQGFDVSQILDTIRAVEPQLLKQTPLARLAADIVANKQTHLGDDLHLQAWEKKIRYLLSFVAHKKSQGMTKEQLYKILSNWPKEILDEIV
ncbi:MAG: hypothetical protein ACMXYF_00285 [Candidatus Woesearchaeota archaeon]